LEFKDQAETVNALIPQLRAKGVNAIAVLIHEGGVQSGTYNDCVGISGAIVDIVNRFDPAVDVVISGHTHQAYNCQLWVVDMVTGQQRDRGRLAQVADHVLHEPHVGLVAGGRGAMRVGGGAAGASTASSIHQQHPPAKPRPHHPP
jgi:hypothetical protein